MTSKDWVVWVVAMLKGGTRKTTTTMELAFGLARRGVAVLVIDADYRSQGVTDWGSKVYAADGELPFDVSQWTPALGLLVPFVQQQARKLKPAYVLVDVGGEDPEAISQLIMIADRVISPVGPEEAETGRLPATRLLVEPSGVPMSVLLTRVPSPGKGLAAAARRGIERAGLHVLATEIEHNRDRYANVWGTVPEDIGAYDALTDELLTGKATA
jgi:hypothetical protein